MASPSDPVNVITRPRALCLEEGCAPLWGRAPSLWHALGATALPHMPCDMPSRASVCCWHAFGAIALPLAIALQGAALRVDW